jgi:hypothetical protein
MVVSKSMEGLKKTSKYFMAVACDLKDGAFRKEKKVVIGYFLYRKPHLRCGGTQGLIKKLTYSTKFM